MAQVLDTPVPNFLIVGAPKCGTTSMYDWLSQHPNVYMSPFKEPRFFCHDLDFHWRYDDLGDYLGLFAPAEETGEDRIGESSVWYLYSEAAPGNIQDLCGEIEIIAMLRNPVDMVHSWHSQLVWMGNEPIEDIEEAWRAVPERKAGKRLPDRPNPVQGLYYDEIAAYHDQVQRYLDTFGAEKVHTIIFDDLVEDNPATYRRVCEFLGIDPSFQPAYEAKNPNTTVRSRWLREVQRDLPGPVKAVTEALPLSLRFKLRELVNRVNTKVEPRPPMPKPLRREIADHYREDVERLSQVLDRDLAHWTEVG